MKVTQAQVDAFKSAWEAKNAEMLDDLGTPYQGESGDRTRAGLEAVAALTSHYQFGTLIDSGFELGEAPGRTDAIVDTTDAILTASVHTVAMLGDDRGLAVMGLRGKINKAESTVEANFIMDWEFAGCVVGEIMKAAAAGGSEAYKLMESGIDRSIEGNSENGKD